MGMLYYFSKNNKETLSKDYINIEEKAKFNKKFKVTDNRIYYIWAKDSNGNNTY